MRAAVAGPGPRARARGAAADALGAAQGGRRASGVDDDGRQRRPAAGARVDVPRLPRARRGRATARRRSSLPRRAAGGLHAARQPGLRRMAARARPTRSQRELGAALGRAWCAGWPRPASTPRAAPRAALARPGPVARARAPGADPPLRAHGDRAAALDAVPRLRADAERGARRVAGGRDRARCTSR